MENCIFCKIIKGEIPSKKVLENNKVIAFYDISPKAPVHVLIVPKKHINSLMDVKKKDKDLMGELLTTATGIAQNLGLNSGGYKLVVNNGRGAGQLVFHLHFHLLGGWKKDATGFAV
ncbi:histidine triad nucleotide-binding protein [Candidatus Gottesmanbacteria bacterium RBG_16_37_8]|uniref:Histidine triad nucleotide-binding protein n=1 Tax=Candidatus Gottesmanbacteria bacterium RBG_16_37_8 TaxID=1798371 RepID=A0A1F5YTS7_9BACT|nr:MAG: histidine triad nucleotide-binding protein [Candidatus Gottesmanbacteria bacterium RBG_16_37_8]